MKNLVYLIAICFTVALIGCESTQTVSPGAVSACGAKDGAPCTKEASKCCHAEKCQRTEAAPGAVSDCQKKSDCQKAGCTKADANMGAVSEGCGAKKSGCGAAKSDCAGKADANLGAVSEKAPCGAVKSGCGR